MAGKERNTKFWQKKSVIKNGREIPSLIPKHILKKDSGWRKIEKAEDIVEIFPPFIANTLAHEIDLYNVWVHESDGAFAKGTYSLFIESAKSQLKDKYKMIMFDNGFSKTQSVSWFSVKQILEEALNITIKENYVDGCIELPIELLKEIEEADNNKKLKKK